MKTKTPAEPKQVKIVNGKRQVSIARKFWDTKFLFILWLPALIYYVVFHYFPMWGISLAFFQYNFWKVYLLGIPGQIAIFLWFRMFRPVKETAKEQNDG